MSNNKRDYSKPISVDEILESAQFNFELKIKHALRHTSLTKGADMMRVQMVQRYEEFMRAYGLSYLDSRIPALLAEWQREMKAYRIRRTPDK
jgi:hypothetical protein